MKSLLEHKAEEYSESITYSSYDVEEFRRKKKWVENAYKEGATHVINEVAKVINSSKDCQSAIFNLGVLIMNFKL